MPACAGMTGKILVRARHAPCALHHAKQLSFPRRRESMFSKFGVMDPRLRGDDNWFWVLRSGRLPLARFLQLLGGAFTDALGGHFHVHRHRAGAGFALPL